MKKDVKIFLIINLVAASVLVPSLIYYFGYYQYQQNQSQNTQLNTMLIPFIWTVQVQGSAVDQPKTMTFLDFQSISNVSKVMVYKTSKEETSHLYSGLSLKHFVYDIMNVSTYSGVTIRAIDGWTITYDKVDIDTWNEDILLVYLTDGLPMLQKVLGGEGPVRTMASQAYRFAKFGDDFNGPLCAKWISIIEINL